MAWTRSILIETIQSAKLCAGWLTLAMASTLAGNLTITGSVANIIVVERAAAEGVHLGFREYFRVGLPVTAATLALASKVRLFPVFVIS